MVSILVPLGYVAFIVGSLALFSRRYRAKDGAGGKSWFPRHQERDIYVSLLSHFTKDDPDAPPPLHPYITAALMRRAMTDIKRMAELRDAKQALTVLLQKGQIGDDIWNHLLAAEKELEAELMEVVQEANNLKPGWGQGILPHAQDMVHHEQYRKVFEGLEAERTKLEDQERIRQVLTSNSLVDPGPLLSLASFQPVGELPAPPHRAPTPAVPSRPMSRVSSAQRQSPVPLGPGKPAQQTANTSGGERSAGMNALKPASPAVNGAASVSADSSDEEASAKPNGSTFHTATPGKKKKNKKKKK